MSVNRVRLGGVSRLRDVFRWSKRLQFLRGHFVIAGGCIVHMTLGSLYTFGNLVPYLISYVRERSGPAHLHSGTGAWIYALALVGQGLSMFVGGLMERRIGPRLSTLVGCGIMSLGVMLSYVAIQVSFWLLLLTYGVMFGLGLGIAYVGPLATAMRWMPKWKGATGGLVLAGFGLGALIFDPIQTVYINPQNKPPDEHGYFLDDAILDRVPNIFLILGAIYIVMQVLGSLLIVDPPEYIEQAPSLLNTDKYENSSMDESVDSRAENFFVREGEYPGYISDRQSSMDGARLPAESPEPECPSPPSSPSRKSRDSMDEISTLIPRDLNSIQQGVPSRRADWHRRQPGARSPDHERMKTFSRVRESDMESSITSLSSLRSTSSHNIVADLKPLQMLKKLNFYVLWIMMLLAGFSVFFTATLYKFFGLSFIKDDHFLAIVGSASAICNCSGRIVWGLIADKVSYKFALVLQSGTMCVFLLTLYSTSLAQKPLFFIWVCVIFFCIGGVFSLFPTAVARSFGAKHVSTNYGLLFTSQIVSSLLAALLFSTLQQHMLGWVGIIFVVSGVCMGGFALTLLFRAKRYVILDLGL